MEDCRRLLGRMGILTYLRRIIQDRVSVVHPKEELQIIAGVQRVRYDLTEEMDGGEGRKVACSVYVGDDMIAEVRGGIDADEAQVRAAAEAILRMRTGG